MSETKNEFLQSLQTLASDAKAQTAIYPDEYTSQELISRYDSSWKRLKSKGYSTLSALQRGRIRALNQYLQTLSDAHDPSFWAEKQALFDDERWIEIRQRAQAVLDSFSS